MTDQTLFSSREFVEAVSRALGDESRALAIPVTGSGPPRTMYALASPAPYRSRYLWLAPFGLFASPGWEGDLVQDTVEGALKSLRKARTRGFAWTVRFDHAALASALEASGIPCRPTSTHVLALEEGYDRVAAAYSSSIRNQVRKATARGVSVRRARTEEDVRAYYKIHARLVEQKDWSGYRYPLALFLELIRLEEHVHLLVAEHEKRVIAGAIFFRDGCSILYWHGATDREYSQLFASRPIFDEAIRWGCETGAKFLNFGASAGIESLEKFKSSWGARPEVNKTFEWTNPLWARLSTLKSALTTPRPHGSHGVTAGSGIGG